jgi:hypothetical protein
LQLLEPFACDLVSFLRLRPESAFGEHFCGFESFLRFLFADLSEGIIEAFREQGFALFRLFYELPRLIENLVESILLLLEFPGDTFAIAFGAERGGGGG